MTRPKVIECTEIELLIEGGDPEQTPTLAG